MLFHRYLDLMKDMDEVLLPWPGDADHGHCFHLFVLRIQPEKLGMDRDAFVAALKEENIGTGIHYRPAHIHPCTAISTPRTRSTCPRTACPTPSGAASAS